MSPSSHHVTIQRLNEKRDRIIAIRERLCERLFLTHGTMSFDILFSRYNKLEKEWIRLSHDVHALANLIS